MSESGAPRVVAWRCAVTPSDMSAAARFLAPRLCEVKMSSFVDLEGRGRAEDVAVFLLVVWERREVRWEAKVWELEEEIVDFGAFLGRGVPERSPFLSDAMIRSCEVVGRSSGWKLVEKSQRYGDLGTMSSNLNSEFGGF